MKKMFSVLPAIVLSIALVTACSSDGTSEAKSLMKKQVAVMEAYVDGLEGAQSAEDMVKAIEQYTADMKELIPKLQEFQKKHPDYEKGVIRGELEEDLKRVEQASDRLPAAMMNSMKYMTDQRVQDAMGRMAKELGELEQE